ncbi:general odorant-binding protein 67-like isoform X2 [Armigeres subalbatus]|uniref:general odorant-binding protein 67-like isoform X2 n=1 Tax=Armigeres subalbatus TaxID=124917 RepID=UPI002ED55451
MRPNFTVCSSELKFSLKAAVLCSVNRRTVFSSIQHRRKQGNSIKNMKLIIVLIATVIGTIATVSGQQQISQECFTRPNDKNPKECCKLPDIKPPHEKFETCKQKFPKPTGPPPTPGNPPQGPPPGFNCMAQCILEQEGVITDGVISKDVATTTLVALVGSSSDWQTAAKTAVDTCYQQVSSLETEKDSLGCSVAAGVFKECLHSTMFTNCPTSSWTASTECDQLKAHVEKGCPLMTLFKGPHKHPH